MSFLKRRLQMFLLFTYAQNFRANVTMFNIFLYNFRLHFYNIASCICNVLQGNALQQA